MICASKVSLFNFESVHKIFSFENFICGADYDEVPPVPIPNTEVKLVCAENTWWVTAREDRSRRI